MPGWKLPEVPTWTIRVIAINFVQFGIVTLAGYTWEKWFSTFSVFHLSNYVNSISGGMIAYFIATFIFYWWHRWRHKIDYLWAHFHQIHYSPQRLEVTTSFYKHPLEMTVNSIVGSLLVYTFLGLDMGLEQYILYVQLLVNSFIIPIQKLLNGLAIYFSVRKFTEYITNMKSILITMAILFGGICYLEPMITRQNLMGLLALISKKNYGLKICYSLKMCIKNKLVPRGTSLSKFINLNILQKNIHYQKKNLYASKT